MSEWPIIAWITHMNPGLQIVLLLTCLLINTWLILTCYVKNREVWFDVFFKIFGSNYFCLFIFHRINIQIGIYLNNPDNFIIWSWINWGAVMLMFLLFLGAYITRSNPVSRANRPREILYPIICGLLPFLIYESPYFNKYETVRESELLVMLFRPFMELSPGHWSPTSIILIIGGHLISVWALVYLRRSFGILTEVRNLVTKGPYSYVRHPLYVGESLATIGFCIFIPSWFNIIVTVAFLIAQRIRAHFEEQKFLVAIPDYEPYMTRTGAYLPRLSKS